LLPAGTARWSANAARPAASSPAALHTAVTPNLLRSLPPQSCFVELETEGVAQPPRGGGGGGGSGGFQLWGRGRGGVWRFRIVEPGGHLLLWLSTDSRASAEAWVSALDAAGLFVLPPGEAAPPPPPLSPSPSRDARPGASGSGGGGGGAGIGGRRRGGTPGRQQQQDWEACSTDSELPEPPSHRRQGASGSGGGGGGALSFPGGALATAGVPPVRGRVPWGRPPPSPSGAGEAPGALFDAAAPAAPAARVSGTGQPSAATAAAAAAAGLPPSSAAAAAAAARRSAGGQGPGGGAGGGGAEAKPPRPPMSGSTPVHTITRYSFLSSDGVWAARHDGLLNLAMIILVVSNLRCEGARSIWL
jgi:hypothetical protein